MNGSHPPSSQDRASQILTAALDYDLADREEILTAACAGDEVLLAEVRALLAAHAAMPEQFLNEPPEVGAPTPASLERDAAPAPEGENDGLDTTLVFQAQALAPTSTPTPTPTLTPKPSSGSGYASELPLPEELQTMLGESYMVESFLGQGGMGAVYRGLQMPLRRPVAIKILAKRQAGETDEFAFEERFKREAYAMASLTHPHIVQVYDCGDAGEHYLFISMELVEGGDLSEAIKSGVCTTAAALKWIPQICEGMQAAHDHGLVHRDIKPANIFLTKDGRAKVADFGLAKKFDAKSNFVTKTGMGMGTPDYAAPEQYDGIPDLDHRADIYSLGVMMYQMLTGRLPRGSGYKTPSEISGVDARIDAVVARAMASDRDDRYQSSSQVAEDLIAIMAPTVTQAVPSAGSMGARSVPTPTGATPRPAVHTGRPATPTPRRVTAGTPTLQRPVAAPPVKQKQKRGAGVIMAALGVVALLAAGAWFVLKPKPPSASHAPPLSSVSSAPSPPVSAPASISSPFGPWRPLFTEAEWKETVPGRREAVDGRMRLLGPGMEKPQPAADGAIRARIQYQVGSTSMGFNARVSEEGRYKLSTNGRDLELHYLTGRGGASEAALSKLGGYVLPKRLQPGDTLLLELRLQGERLTGLADGAVVIEARDSRLTAPGKWGIIANDGWFESVEVQTPPPAAAPVANAFGPWQPFYTDAEWKETIPRQREFIEGRLRTQGSPGSKPQPSADGAIRGRIQYREGSQYVGFEARKMSNAGRYKAHLHSAYKVQLDHYLPGESSSGGESTPLGTYYLPKRLQPGDTLLLELRLQGDRLTVLVNDEVGIEARDSRLPGPGEWGIVGTNGWFESVEVQTPPVSASSPFGPWQPLFTDAEWNAPNVKNREVVNGRVHLAPFASMLKPQAVADGAIRARIQYQQGSKGAGFFVRLMPDGGLYKAELGTNRTISLNYFPPGSTSPEGTLGKYDLPKLLQPGDTLLLELRLQSDRLTVLADGTVAIDTRDSRLTAPGKWGIIATDGWFESVEVQTPLPASPAITATKDAPFVNSLGMKFVPVPGTDVLFCIHETRWRDYAVYAAEGGTVNGRANDWAPAMSKAAPDFPAAHINWDNAEAFCAWLSRKEGRTYRLPTDREWSYAVGIGEQETWNADTTPATVNKVPDQFPWGTEWPPPKGAGNYRDETFNAKNPKADGNYLNGYDDGFPLSSPVMSFTPNRLGLYDLGGNMAEWVSDWHDAGKQARVMRGIGWAHDHGRGDLLSSRRVPFKRDPGSSANVIDGFRVVVAASTVARHSHVETPTLQTPTAATSESRATSATKDAPFMNSLGMKFVPVPGTDVLFCIHETRWRDCAAYVQSPAGAEVSARWKSAILEGGKDRPDIPAAHMTWDEAQAFCAWLSRQEGLTYRLPTDREWSYAVGIGEQETWNADTMPGTVNQVPDHFPWGIEWPPPKGAGNYRDESSYARAPDLKIPYLKGYEDSFIPTSPVMSFPANRLGIYDLGGNVAEWIGDWYNAAKRARVSRGAGYSSAAQADLLSSKRSSASSTFTNSSLGFRVVVVPSAVARRSPVETPIPQPQPPTASALESRATAATKDAPLTNSLGMKFVPVPITGGLTAGRTVLFSMWETRVQDYEAFATETKREWPKPEFAQEATHPAVNMNWGDATAFCTWLTERERKTGKLAATDSYRLPSDHEWSCAVGIGAQEDPAKLPGEKSLLLRDIYPWGGEWPAPDDAGNYSSAETEALSRTLVRAVLATRRDGYGASAPVGTYRANSLGLHDLGGNVWEWCEDWLDEKRDSRVQRGAGFSNETGYWAMSSRRLGVPTKVSRSIVGFRCVLEMATPPAATATTKTVAPKVDKDGWATLFTGSNPGLLPSGYGAWQLAAGELSSPVERSAIPLAGFFAQVSYQVRVKLRQAGAADGFHLILPVGDRAVLFGVDSWGGACTSLSKVESRSGLTIPGHVAQKQINDTDPHDLEVAVRLDGVNATITATLDARPLFTWAGPIASLSVWASWGDPAPGALYLAAATKGWFVSEVKAKQL